MRKEINNVLVAENKGIDAAYLRLMLERNGWKADIVTDGEEALRRIEEKQYAFLLISNNLNSLKGTEVIGKIRESEAISQSHLPILGVASCSLVSERKKYLNAGVDYCITKPVYQRSLFEIINTLFEDINISVSVA